MRGIVSWLKIKTRSGSGRKNWAKAIISKPSSLASHCNGSHFLKSILNHLDSGHIQISPHGPHNAVRREGHSPFTGDVILGKQNEIQSWASKLCLFPIALCLVFKERLLDY